ncbi:hypothetical protein TrLO_g10523, partial [Triparma laevis f. longispina]
TSLYSCPSGKFGTSIPSSCEGCTAGKFSAFPDTSSCTNCPGGKTNEASSSSCPTKCPAGTYSSGTPCLPCTAGRYCTESSSTDQGVGSSTDQGAGPCAVGYSCPEGSTTNQGIGQCAVGRYCPAGSTTDQGAGPCAAGYYCPQGSTSSEGAGPCAAGEYSMPGSGSCSVCPAGTSLTDDGTLHTSIDDCLVCPAGTYNPDDATSASLHFTCTACLAGYEIKDDGQDIAKHDHANDCEICQANTFSNFETGHLVCTDCPPGEISSAGSSKCCKCPPGFICQHDGDGNVLSTAVCLAGTYSHCEAQCKECEPGYKCPGGINHVPCLPGYHQAAPSSAKCEPCEAGKYQANPGRENCDKCRAGYFCPKGSVDPIECGSKALFCPANATTVQPTSEGYYTTPATEDASTTRYGQTICEAGFACVGGTKKLCNGNGQYADVEGLSACKIAPAGMKPTSDRKGVELCKLGSVSSGAQDECTSCSGDGQYADKPGLAPPGMKPTIDGQNVTTCDAGSFSLGSADTCNECDAGTPADEGASVCTPCPQYEEQDTEFGFGLNSCVCQNTFVRVDGICTCKSGFTLTGKTCSRCEKGRFKEDFGVHSCERCEGVLKGSVTSSESSVSSGDCACPAGNFDNMKGGCVDVFEGVDPFTPGMTLERLKLEPGWWRTGPTSTDVRECPIADVCIGGSTDNYCREGHEGPYCNLCNEGWTLDPLMLCKSCDNNSTDLVMTVLIYAGLALITGAIFCVAKKKAKGNKMVFKRFKNGVKVRNCEERTTTTRSEATNHLRGVANHNDVASVVPAIALPQKFQKVMKAASFLSIDVFSLISVGCWAGNLNYYDQVLFMTLLIIIICGLLVVTGWLLKSIRSLCFTASIAITYLVLPTITTKIFGVFPCDWMDVGSHMLRKDYSINCDADNRVFWVSYGWLMVVLFPIGVVIGYGLRLSSMKEKLRRSVEERFEDESIMPFMFLWEPYKLKFWYFEVVETARRLMMTGGVVLAVNLCIIFVVFLTWAAIQKDDISTSSTSHAIKSMMGSQKAKIGGGGHLGVLGFEEPGVGVQMSDIVERKGSAFGAENPMFRGRKV